MKEVLAWLDHIRLFQISQSEFHMYMGTMNKPRSTLVPISSGELKEPVRVPQISDKELQSRYPKGLTVAELAPHLKLTFQLLKLLPAESILDEYTYFIDDYQYTAKIPKSIKTWLNSNIPFPELQPFMRVIGSACINSRQRALMELFEFRSEESVLLGLLLFQMREEFRKAIIREAGRQDLKLDYLIEYSNRAVHKTSGLSIELIYLYKYLKDHFRQHHYFIDLNYQSNTFVSQSSQGLMRSFLAMIKDPQASLNFLIMLSENDSEKFYTTMEFILNNLNVVAVDAKLLRKKLMPLIRFVEIVPNTQLIGFILAMSMLGFVPDDSCKYKRTSFGSVFRYVRFRLLSLFHLWIKSSKNADVSSSLYHFISFYPLSLPRPDVNQSDLELWLQDHPVLHNFKDQLDIGYQFTLFKRIFQHLLKIDHPLLKSIILQYCPADEFYHDLLADNDNLGIIFGYRDYFGKAPEITGIIHSLEPLQITSEILKIAAQMKLQLAPNLLQNYLKHNNIDDTLLKTLQTYIKNTAELNKDLVSEYFDVILNEIKNDPTSSTSQVLATRVLLNWQAYTGQFPSEQVQDTILALKIVYDEIIPDNDIEPTTNLSIETIVLSYKLTGSIPKLIETNVQFAFTKPHMDQLARHYLAMALQRPPMELLAKSRLREIPTYITRDVLGQIALINQTINYCQSHGFNPGFENLISQNIYRRGWNIDRKLERILPSILGSLTQRMRSYFAAYLVVDQGEILKDLLKLARDVENYQIRERLVRELERYGTPDMWFELTESYYPSMAIQSRKHLLETRMSATQRSQTIRQLLHSNQPENRAAGLRLLAQYGLQQDDLNYLFYNPFQELWEPLIEYILDNRQHLTDIHQQGIYHLIRKILWMPALKRSTRNMAIRLVPLLWDLSLRAELRKEMEQLSQVKIEARSADAFRVLVLLR